MKKAEDTLFLAESFGVVTGMHYLSCTFRACDFSAACFIDCLFEDCMQQFCDLREASSVRCTFTGLTTSQQPETAQAPAVMVQNSVRFYGMDIGHSVLSKEDAATLQKCGAILCEVGAEEALRKLGCQETIVAVDSLNSPVSIGIALCMLQDADLAVVTDGGACCIGDGGLPLIEALDHAGIVWSMSKIMPAFAQAAIKSGFCGTDLYFAGFILHRGQMDRVWSVLQVASVVVFYCVVEEVKKYLLGAPPGCEVVLFYDMGKPSSKTVRFSAGSILPELDKGMEVTVVLHMPNVNFRGERMKCVRCGDIDNNILVCPECGENHSLSESAATSGYVYVVTLFGNVFGVFSTTIKSQECVERLLMDNKNESVKQWSCKIH